MASTAPHVEPTEIVSVELVTRALELVPIPAVQVCRQDGALSVYATNRAYRLAGFGVVSERSPMLAALGDRITTFLDAGQVRTEFEWTIGEVVDCRYYRVTIARSSVAVHDRCMVMFVDQTSRVHTERSMQREMTTDSLTGLPNREGFEDILEREADRDNVAVLAIDLDRFGRLNACLGSLAGDELLITVARRIKGALRARDTLARLGGDQFGILMAIDDNRDEAHQLARRIRQTLATPFRLTTYEISVECSVGIAYGADEPGEGAELVRHAQFAVKRAKVSGRSESYLTQDFTIARDAFAMETALRRAIENRRLHLTYQPICDLATGRVTSFEALARWTDEDGREYAPNDFIPVAEESGLIVPLGRWAIEEAARTLAAWDLAAGGNCGVKVAVNLSAIQLQRDDIAPVVAAALAATGLSGHRFTLELTESAIVSDPDRIAGAMHALKSLGTTLAMDDFGTGYSNLAYLQKLPIDVLKIDRSFVTEMLADRDKVSIVRAILSLAQALGMKTTAEGVETNELAQTLAALGCTYGQGYFFARPLAADAAFAMLGFAAPPS
ncbi:bifunctional diguanylate cyclase/phosphodiesterase [Sphingomonas ginsenosidivorax]|uniref:Bifunctional diguanylate cyclase/phosphodiesterase n=1 Tax=Sphingomonas ginsenosidivorax TaxID=862135 RepID=A0A5C6UD80_9SPHN|nr:bifunctional diguanylate cyclase/phosphodiesterase [Sphingomonas ginsenosidivorax]TXC70703.1 bifunctional diguanylate cyclase/phosphodiesterase [Sphingomonas ginsenosidivorax]